MKYIYIKTQFKSSEFKDGSISHKHLHTEGITHTLPLGGIPGQENR